MKKISRFRQLGIVCGTLALFAFASTAWAAGRCFLCRNAAVNMPVSLAVGTVRTPEFPVKHEAYEISIQVERRIPLGELDCMMGVKFSWEHDHCAKFNFERLLDADWKVLDGDRIVAQGSVHGTDDNFGTSKEFLSRVLGTFVGEKDKKYVLEVKFTKDGTPLNVTNPHLIVMMTKATDI
jgi:hypothetical protein